jgi:hypothetical protein
VKEMEGGEEDKEVAHLPGVVGLVDADVREAAELHAEERQARCGRRAWCPGMRWKTPVFPRGSTWAENQSRRSQMHILGRHVNFSMCGLDSARHGVLGRFHSNPRLAKRSLRSQQGDQTILGNGGKNLLRNGSKLTLMAPSLLAREHVAGALRSETKLKTSLWQELEL